MNVENIKGLQHFYKENDTASVSQWKDLKYGMFIHWGLYSKLGGVWQNENVTQGYSEQIQMWANISEADYLKVAADFTAEAFDADEICKLAKEAGMNYIVFTTKHHDGFCMYETQTTTYNIVEKTPFARDPLKMLQIACEKYDLKLGLYYSLVDWHQGHAFDFDNNNPISPTIEEIIEKQLKELLTNYGDICEVWFDMSSPTERQSRKFKQIVRAYQAEAIVNSRIWNNLGDFRTLSDNEVPTKKIKGPWQTPASIYQETWGYRAWQKRENSAGKTKELIKGLMGGGNYLLNIGPKGDGSLVPFEKDVLLDIGRWLKQHPHLLDVQKSDVIDQYAWGKVKMSQDKLYLIVETIPESNEIKIQGLINQVEGVKCYDDKKEISSWHKENDVLTIFLSKTLSSKTLPVIEVALKDKLALIPSKTQKLTLSETRIPSDAFYYQYGYHETGNYTSMTQNIVDVRIFVLSPSSQLVSLEFLGAFNPKENYLLSVDHQIKRLEGAAIQNKTIGTFEVEKDKVTEILLTLAHPTHIGHPLGVGLKNMIVKSQKNLNNI